MGVLSKCSKSTSFTCYDVGHTWDPSCGSSALKMGFSVFQQSVKIYGVLYFATALLKARGLDPRGLKRAAFSTIKSSSFLSVNAAGFLAGFCLLGKLKGGLWASSHAWLPGLMASFAAINIENPERQKMLSLYVLNVATETLLRMSHARGWNLPGVDSKKWTLVFSMVSAMAMYMKQEGLLKDGLMANALRYVSGDRPWEKKGAKMTPSSCKTCGQGTQGSVNAMADEGRLLESSMELRKSCISKIESNSGNAGHVCPVCGGQPTERNNNEVSKNSVLGHGLSIRPAAAHHAALSYSPLPNNKQLQDDIKKEKGDDQAWAVVKYCLQGFVRPFAVGLAMTSLLKMVGKPGQLLRSPSKFLATLLRKPETYRLGLFMGAFTGIYRVVRSSLTNPHQNSLDCNGNECPQNYPSSQESWKEAMAGFAAGSAMLVYPSSSVVINAAWRCIQASLEHGMTHGFGADGSRKLPAIPAGASKWLYALGCAVIFQAAVLEPHNLKGSYWRFLNKATDGTIAQMNRSLMDPLGYASSTISPDFRPNYNWRLISPALRKLYTIAAQGSPASPA